MLRYTIRRLAVAAVLLWIVLTVTFALLHLTPGDPARQVLDPRVAPEQIERLRTEWGLDRPLPLQYLAWLRGVLTANLGISYSHRTPVASVLAQAIPPTLLLTGTALLLQFGIGVAGGAAAALRPGTWVDHLLRVVSQTLYAMPAFWLGLMAILLFSERLGVLPPGGIGSPLAIGGSPLERATDLLRHLVLPATVLGIASAGRIQRYARNGLLETLGEGFIEAAHARGLSRRRILLRHALPASLSPLLHALGLALPILLSGALVIEVVFAWPGLGRTTYNAILARDYPLILASTTLSASLVVVGSLVADLLQAAVDPRSRGT